MNPSTEKVGQAPLPLAAKSGHVDTGRALVLEAKVEVNARDKVKKDGAGDDVSSLTSPFPSLL